MSWAVTAFWVGLSVTVDAGIREAQVQKRQGENANAIAENNARLAEEKAQDEAVLGARESQQAAWRARALLGAQRAAVAANGLDSEIGTPFDLGGETALFGGADQSSININAARKAWGFGAEALNYRNEGATAKWFGKQSAKVTYLKTAGSAVSMYGGGVRSGTI